MSTPGEGDATRGSSPARIPPGGRRELGRINWVLSRLGARAIRAPQMHVATVLGQHRRLFWTWLPFAGVLLLRGELPREDTESVILRVGHLRNCEYELQQHRRIAKRFGVDDESQAKIIHGPQADGLTDRQRVLLTATDEFVTTRTLSAETWQSLSRYLDRRQLIEFVTLVGQYDALAATLNTLEVPLDFPATDT